MSAKSMDVFSLRDHVVREYEKFATSFTTIHADDIRAQVEAIYAEDRYWPEPLIQINPQYKRSTTVEAETAAGTLHPKCAEIFRADGETLSLYDHQKQAIALASQGESYVVTTGTGSGKSLCFFIPIAARQRDLPIYRGEGIVRKELDVTSARRVAADLPPPLFNADRRLQALEMLETE